MTSHRLLLTSMLAPLALAAGSAHAQSAPTPAPQADAEHLFGNNHLHVNRRVTPQDHSP